MSPRRKRRNDPPEEELLAREARRVTSMAMHMLEINPFWGHLLLQLELVPAPDLSTFAATDCVRRIWYNPWYTRHLRTPQVGFVLAHELGHHLLASEPRRRGRNPRLWNCATDYAINRIVAQVRAYETPNGKHPDLGQVSILLDPRFDGLTAEAIYERLLEDGHTVKVKTIAIDLPGGCGDDGFSADGVRDHRGGIDVHLPVELTPEQQEELEERIAETAAEARRAGQRGDLSGGLIREVGPVARARLPWSQLLRRFLEEALVRDELSLRRPNRRYLAEDLLVPGLVPGDSAHVVVALDTSASMSKDALRELAGEIQAIAAFAREVTLIEHDAEVQRVVGSLDLPAHLRCGRFQGGGGTSHLPVFGWIEAERIKPDVFVGLTDLWSVYPKDEPGFPVIWVVPPKSGKAPWGKVVRQDGGQVFQRAQLTPRT